MYVDSGEVGQKSLYWMSEADYQSTGDSWSLLKYPAGEKNGYEKTTDVHKRKDKSESKSMDTYWNC